MSQKRFRAFVDRIEEDKALLRIGDDESGELLLPVEYLPDATGEGSVLTIDVKYEPELTRKAVEKAEDLIRRLSER